MTDIFYKQNLLQQKAKREKTLLGEHYIMYLSKIQTNKLIPYFKEKT